MFKITDSNYNVSSFGAAMMIIGAVSFLPILVLCLWFNIPDTVLKIAGTVMVGGLFIAIIGLFIPHD